MALPATAVIEVRTTGSDTQCAGGFNPARAGTDYSQQNAAQATGTATSVTTTVTATTGIFTAAMVGNYITDGTTPKEITAFTSATIVTVDSAPSWTGATIYVGGALASPGLALGISVARNTVWIKSTATYAIGSGTVNTSGNKCSLAVSGLFVSGYSTTRGDGGRATLQASTTAFNIMTITAGANNLVCESLVFDGNSQTSVLGFNFSGGSSGIRFRLCKAINCPGGGFSGGFNSFGGEFIQCEATGCGLNSFAGGSVWAAFGCVSTGGSVGFANFGVMAFCIAYANSSHGFVVGNSCSGFFNCTSYGNTNGFYLNSSTGAVGSTPIINCIFYGNSALGIRIDDTTNARPTVLNCAGGNNTSGNITGGLLASGVSIATLSGDPFTAAGSGDFSLNNTAGAGAVCRAAGFPGVYPLALTTGYLDIGAAQSQASGGSAGMLFIPNLEGT